MSTKHESDYHPLSKKALMREKEKKSKIQYLRLKYDGSLRFIDYSKEVNAPELQEIASDLDDVANLLNSPKKTDD